MKYEASCIGDVCASAQYGARDLRVYLARFPSVRKETMLRWALAFFVIAIVAAILGFAGIAVAAAGIAKILFYIFLVLFLIALVGGLTRRV
jgi:uncharacterized membrane protein YtjA (UPF0391 family)